MKTVEIWRVTWTLPLFAALLLVPASPLNSNPAGKYADYDYSRIDQHALQCPKEMETDIKTLVGYLTQPAQNEHEKLRAVFRWITANIAYDTEGFFDELSAKEKEMDKAAAGGVEALPAGSQEPEGAAAQAQQPEAAQTPGGNKLITPDLVLQKRTANCDGYAVLTEAMLNEALSGLMGGSNLSGSGEGISTVSGALGNLKILQIKGFAKGYGYKVGAELSGTNHAWNAVQLDGQWYFLDCTWGSGRPNEQNVFCPGIRGLLLSGPGGRADLYPLPGKPGLAAPANSGRPGKLYQDALCLAQVFQIWNPTGEPPGLCHRNRQQQCNAVPERAR